MSETIDWIAAQAEPPGAGESLGGILRDGTPQKGTSSERADALKLNLPVHQFPGRVGEMQAHPPDDWVIAWEEERERRIYRGRTTAMLRRYLRYSMETGRLPSLVGREFFRSNVTKYQVATFEDRVIFVHDMETSLQKLDEFSRQVLGRVVLQEYGHEDAARLLGCTRMTLHRKLIEGLDKLSAILLEVHLLDAVSTNSKKPCQGGQTEDFRVSNCNDGE